MPSDAWVAMDYHLDWLQVALFLAQTAADEAAVHCNTERLVRGTQEDVDLIVAFAEAGAVHLLLLEAKAETGWTNKQMRSKARQLGQIFGADGRRYDGVQPDFALLSPRRPQHLHSSEWPAWMRRGTEAIWLPLAVPPGRRKVIRCDTNGKASAGGGYFRVGRE